MRQVEVDAERGMATVGGGATVRDVIDAAAQQGLVAVAGGCGSVGMAGLTLGGGYSPLSPRYGLAVDNLLGVEIVLADGRRITVCDLEHPELFWALRGGGGNFGVVTALRIRLHPMRELLAGMILFPLSDAGSVLRGYAEIMASAPDELTVMAGMMSPPDVGPVVFLAPVWSGSPSAGEECMTVLRRLGKPIVSQVSAMTFGDLLGMFDDHVVNGRHYALETRWLTELAPALLSELVAGEDARTSPFSMIMLHHFHGAAARISASATAFGLRREHFMLEILAAWDSAPGDDGTSHRRWAGELSRMAARHASPGGYPNVLGPEAYDQIPFAHGSNIGRLRDVKGRFDADNIFSGIPLAI